MEVSLEGVVCGVTYTLSTLMAKGTLMVLGASYQMFFFFTSQISQKSETKNSNYL
jgi:hypothetical protein